MYSAFVVGDDQGDFGLFPFHLMLFVGFGYVFFKSLFPQRCNDHVSGRQVKYPEVLLSVTLCIIGFIFLPAYDLDRTNFTQLINSIL